MVQSHDITEAEAALYDRQIRLWGLDAQKRLRGSRILVIGMSGLGAEVCKNIVLAGIKSLTMLDSTTVTTKDFTSNFLIPRDQLGKNRAEACLARVQQLNPMVEVTPDSGELESKPDTYFTDYDVICATGCTNKQLFKLNLLCRENRIQFYCGDVWGFIGFMFSDLMEHEYAEEQNVVEVGKTDDDSESDEPATKKKKTSQETKMVKKTCEFTTLRDALDVDWCSDRYASRVKRVEPTFFMMQALQQFYETHSRRPDGETKESDVEELKKITASIVTQQSLPAAKVDTVYTSSVFGELSPVCAVIGGVLAQEIIKAVSHKDEPINNFFFYNSLSGNGIVECIGD